MVNAQSIIYKELGYDFAQPSLLTNALTHSTYAYELLGDRIYSNERLEFLGDSVLQLITTEYLFGTYPKMSEGVLSRVRATVVCEPTLAKIASKWKLSKMLLLGCGEQQCGGTTNVSNLANAVEAVIGAIYLDSNFEKVKNVVMPWFLPYITAAMSGKLTYDYKSRVLEWMQAHPSNNLEFKVICQGGVSHAPIFTTGIFWNGKLVYQGEASSKKESQQKAAMAFFENVIEPTNAADASKLKPDET